MPITNTKKFIGDCINPICRRKYLEQHSLETKNKNLQDNNYYQNGKLTKLMESITNQNSQIKLKDKKIDTIKKANATQEELINTQQKDNAKLNVQNELESGTLSAVREDNHLAPNKLKLSISIQDDTQQQIADKGLSSFNNQKQGNEIFEQKKKNLTLTNENEQLKEVGEMLDSVIQFLHNNEVLYKKREDLKQRKNNLRLEVEKQLTSLGDLASQNNQIVREQSVSSPRMPSPPRSINKNSMNILNSVASNTKSRNEIGSMEKEGMNKSNLNTFNPYSNPFLLQKKQELEQRRIMSSHMNQNKYLTNVMNDDAKG